jgi:hypothetical protein
MAIMKLEAITAASASGRRVERAFNCVLFGLIGEAARRSRGL